MYRADNTMAMKEEIQERIHLCLIIKIVDDVACATEKKSRLLESNDSSTQDQSREYYDRFRKKGRKSKRTTRWELRGQAGG